ncbi:hypothetical protein [Streptacidiphilus sp. PAMC 29251]
MTGAGLLGAGTGVGTGAGTVAVSLPARTVPLLRLGDWYASLDSAPPPAPGLPALSLAPEILVRADARRLRATSTVRPPEPAARIALLRRALRRFAGGTVECGGLGPQSAGQFRELLRRADGLPGALVDRWCALLATELDALVAAPAGVVAEDSAPDGAGDGLRIGLVALPGNTFTCLVAVLETALSGSAVWVRPSSREAFSALRLLSALRQEGWPAPLLGFYPCTQQVLPTLIKVTDHQIIYGGAEVCARLGGVPSAETRGPLRVCAVVPAGAEPEAAAAWLAPLVASDAGRFCTAVRAVLCLGEADPVAEALARLLDAIPFSPADPDLPLADFPDPARAAALAEALTSRIGAGDRTVTVRPLLSSDASATGTARLAPTVVRLAEPPSPAAPLSPAARPRAVAPAWGDPALLGFEAPFPLATVLRVTPGQAAALTAGADLVHHLPTQAMEGARG